MLEFMPPFYFLTFAKVSKTFDLKKSLGIGFENIWSQKKSWYRSRKDLVSKKSLSIGLENFGLKKVSVSVSKTFVSKKVLAMLISFSKEIQVILLKDFVS